LKYLVAGERYNAITTIDETLFPIAASSLSALCGFQILIAASVAFHDLEAIPVCSNRVHATDTDYSLIAAHLSGLVGGFEHPYGGNQNQPVLMISMAEPAP